MFAEKTISDYLCASAVRRPSHMAFVYHQLRHTWGEVNGRVNQLTRALIRIGVQRGDVVAVCCQDGPVLVETLFAIARIGAIRVGINYRYTASDVQTLLKHCNAKVLVVQQDFRALAADCGETKILDCGDGQCSFGELGELMDAESASLVPTEAVETDIAQICYTTGSTGVPKGALWTHRALTHAMSHTLLDLGMTSRDVWLHCLPGAGVPSVLAVWNAVLGFTNVIQKSFDPVGALQAIERHGVTRTVWVPTMLAAVCQAAEAGNYQVKSRKRISYGSAPTPPALIRRALLSFEGVHFDQWYGSTEGTGGWFTQLTPEDHVRALAGEESLLESCGKPMHHAEVKVVDETGADAPVGTIGEICVRGAFVMEGYHNQPLATQQALVEGWLHTGDMGRMDPEGFFYLVDRKQFMVITGGYNVYPVEVENVLASHPQVLEVCVFGIPDDKWGEAVQALVVLKTHASVQPDELKAWCKERLASFKVPKSIVVSGSLLRGPTGKIQKRAIRDNYLATR